LWDWFERGQEWGPRMEMSETDREVTLRFELPGVRTEDVDISLSGNVLTVGGEKSEQRDERRGRVHYSERSFGRFCRSVQLPTTVDPDKVDASYKDGVLVVTVAKRPDARAKKVAVRNR
ncbi:MAG: Hsp20/alpha crystallin family protein, partial [Phycisphaerae bacterium]